VFEISQTEQERNQNAMICPKEVNKTTKFGKVKKKKFHTQLIVKHIDQGVEERSVETHMCFE
jgi:hypothetical protein